MGVRSDARICQACGRVDAAAQMERLPSAAEAPHEAPYRCRDCARAPMSPPPFETWEAEGFQRRLWAAPRLVVFYHAATWCAASRSALELCVEAEEECSVPVVAADLRHPLDPRWDDAGIRTVPTLAYYEAGEELERLEAARGYGLDQRDVAGFFATVEDLQEEPKLPRRLRRFSSRRTSRG